MSLPPVCHQLWYLPVPAQKDQGTPLLFACPTTSSLAQVPAWGPTGPCPSPAPSASTSRRVVNAMGVIPGGSRCQSGLCGGCSPVTGGARCDLGRRNWRLGSGRSFIEHLAQVGRPHPAAGPGTGGSFLPAWRMAQGCRFPDGAPAASFPMGGVPRAPPAWGDTAGRVTAPWVGAALGGRGEGTAGVCPWAGVRGRMCPPCRLSPQPGFGGEHGVGTEPPSPSLGGASFSSSAC